MLIFPEKIFFYYRGFMLQFNWKKIIELEERLAKKIKRLADEINQHPAARRKKQDEINREDFSTVFLLAGLMGIIIFGAGWLVVALSGTLLSLIIVETGLFSSMAIGFNGKPLYNAYLWIRDLLSTEKIKNQNKDFDQIYKQLLELEALAAKKSVLIARINYQLNKALQWLPSKLFSEAKNELEQLPLKEQIQKLEQKRQTLPAYRRREKDRRVSNEINEHWKFYLLGAVFGNVILILVLLVYPPLVLLAPSTMALLFIPIAIALAFGPIIVSNIMRMTYLWMRDVFSSPEIKAENEQLTQIEKTIDKLFDLEKQLQHLAKTIFNQLESMDNLSQSDVAPEKAQSMAKGLKIDNFEKNVKYGPLFQQVPANQAVDSSLSANPSLTH